MDEHLKSAIFALKVGHPFLKGVDGRVIDFKKIHCNGVVGCEMEQQMQDLYY